MTKLQKDQLLILLESMDSKMQLTLEAVSSVDHKIDSVRDELKEDIAVLDCKIMGLSKRVDSVEKNLSDRIDEVEKSLSDRIDVVEKSLSDRIDEVEKSLSDRIDVVEKSLSDRIDEVEKNLSDRIDVVEKNLSDRIDVVDKKVDAVHDELIAHRNDTELHRSQPKRPLKRMA